MQVGDQQRAIVGNIKGAGEIGLQLDAAQHKLGAEALRRNRLLR